MNRSRGWRLLLVSAIVFINPSARAASGARDKIIAFLKANVLGRTLVSEFSTSRNESKTIEFEFKLTTRQVNLTTSEIGLTFDIFSQIKQNNYDLRNGVRTSDKPSQIVDRDMLSRIEVRESQNLPEMYGLNRLISLTLLDPTGGGEGVRLRLEGDTLVMTSITPFYGECFAENGKFRICRTRSEEIYSVENGKLKQVTKAKSYYVNPETLENESPFKDTSFISKEP
jgi:hypothetical protein